MGNPVQLSIDENDKESLERAAARAGITVQEYLKRVAAGTLRPLPAWQAPQPHLPAAAPAAAHPPRTMQETMDAMMERMMMMNMMRTMPGLFQDVTTMGAKPLSAEDVERILDSRLKRNGDGEGDDSMMKMFREGYRMKMLTKAMSGMEEDAPPALKREMQEVRERFEKAQAELMGKLQSKDDEIRRKEEAEREANRAQQIEALRQDSLAAIQKLEQQLLQIRSTNAQPPRDQIDQLAEGLTRLDALRGKLDTVFGGKEAKSQKPWWIDEIREMINVAGDNAGKVLEGVGAVEAGRRGLPPPGQNANSPPGTSPVYNPNYVDTRTAPPRPAGGADPYPMLAGYATDPADLSTWPDIPYSEEDPATRQIRPMAKGDFVQRYGTRIHAEREAAGVLPKPPAAPPEVGDPFAALSGGTVPGTTSLPPSPPVAAPAEAPPEAPSLLSALSGGAPIEVPGAPSAPPPAPTAAPPPPPSEEPAAPETKEPEIPEGVFGRAGTSVPMTVDLDGNAVDG